LPAVYEKTCDLMTDTCQVLIAPADHFLSAPTGTRTGYAVFDTSVIPAARTVKDAILVLYSAMAGTFTASYIALPSADPRASVNAAPSIDLATSSLGGLYSGSSMMQTGYFGLPMVASGAAVWVRAGLEPKGAVTTLLAIIAGWRTGATPNNGVSFILDIGEATSSKGKPASALAVCLNP
jgi:hypothetical protein